MPDECVICKKNCINYVILSLSEIVFAYSFFVLEDVQQLQHQYQVHR